MNGDADINKWSITWRLIFFLTLSLLLVPIVYFWADKGSNSYLVFWIIVLLFWIVKIITVVDAYTADKKLNIKWKFTLKNMISTDAGTTFIYFIFWMILCHFRYCTFAEIPEQPDIVVKTSRYLIQVCMDALVAGVTIMQINIKELFVRLEVHK